MNKLVIIGNGFDLAHGLPTSYKDFILWHINKVYQMNYSGKTESNLIEIETDFDRSCVPDISKYEDYKKLKELNGQEKGFNFIVKGKHYFIDSLLTSIDKYGWVDIEKRYFNSLTSVGTEALAIELNECMRFVIDELKEYIGLINKTNDSTLHDFKEILRSEAETVSSEEYFLVLNFNYTTTIENYFYILPNRYEIIYIHGHIGNDKNPIIFGYGDETDNSYTQLENRNVNTFLQYMKSFAYLQTSNYKELFHYLDRMNRFANPDKFDVVIMGHSCGLSDRLLFTHIFEHEALNSVKIYYYEYLNEKKNEIENDFIDKTQNISRYFKNDQKHKMRKIIIPFNESQPLPQVKQKTN